MKKSFIFYSNWAEMIAELPDDVAGKLVKMICVYTLTGNTIKTDSTVTAIFKSIKPLLDRDTEKYQKKVERIAELNKKRQETKSDRNHSDISTKSERNRDEIVTKSERNRDEIVGDNVNVNVNDNVNVLSKDNNIYIVGKPDYTPDIKSIIDYLNQKTQSNFKAKTEATKKSIIARLKEGYTVEDFKRVIDAKVKDWSDDPDMREYLRPQTLFRPSNFESYLNEANRPAVKSKNSFRNFDQREYTEEELEKLISN